MRTDAILIAGPTASGKTGLSIELAKQLNGVVINTDSMQVYDILSVLTARPSIYEMDNIPHKLFGHINPSHSYSTAQWIEEVKAELKEAINIGKLPIFVGGTGLYFKALLEGLSSVPDIDPKIRNKWRDYSLSAKDGELHAELARVDTLYAQALNAGDTQRLVRALEVVESTGKSLQYWQSLGNNTPLIDTTKAKKIILMPERSFLNERIAMRFTQMLEHGAIDEVEALLALELSGECPAMRAIGVSQIAKYLSDEITVEQAGELATIATRQYAKRQSTWFRNQFSEGWNTFDNPMDAQTNIINYL